MNSSLGALSDLHYFLGNEALQNSESLYLNQTKYIKYLLKNTSLTNGNVRPTPMVSSKKLFKNDSDLFCDGSLYPKKKKQKAIDSLQYLMYFEGTTPHGLYFKDALPLNSLIV